MGAPHLSPFDTLEACFRLLTTRPAPLALDGRQIGHGAPARQIPLDELRALLHHPATIDDLKETVLQELARLAAEHNSIWIVGLAGVLLPGLRAIARLAPPARHAVGNHPEADLLERFQTAILQPQLQAVQFASAVLRFVLSESQAGSLPRFRPHR